MLLRRTTPLFVAVVSTIVIVVTPVAVGYTASVVTLKAVAVAVASGRRIGR
jgi:hypothetical protein